MIEFLAQYIGMPKGLINWLITNPGAEFFLVVIGILIVSIVTISIYSFYKEGRLHPASAAVGMCLSYGFGLIGLLAFKHPYDSYKNAQAEKTRQEEVAAGKRLPDGTLIILPESKCKVVNGKAYLVVPGGVTPTDRCP